MSKGWTEILCFLSKIIVIENIFFPKVEIKDCNVIAGDRNFINQPVKNNTRTYKVVWRNAICQRDDYSIECLYDYTYLKKVQINNYRFV